MLFSFLFSIYKTLGYIIDFTVFGFFDQGFVVYDTVLLHFCRLMGTCLMQIDVIFRFVLYVTLHSFLFLLYVLRWTSSYVDALKIVLDYEIATKSRFIKKRHYKPCEFEFYLCYYDNICFAVA